MAAKNHSVDSTALERHACVPGCERTHQAKVLPIALNVVALSIILFGNRWTVVAHEAESDRARLRPRLGSVDLEREGQPAPWGG
jgi:hypothetical protein